MKIFPNFSDKIALSKGDIHLWVLEVPKFTESIPLYESLLSEQERTKAYRFKFEKDRNISILARGVLRLLLAHY